MAMKPKHRRFVSEYIKDQNGTQAAIRAGYSKKTAQEQSSDLLSKPIIRAAVDAALEKIHSNAEVTQERILKALLNIAESDLRQAFNADGTIRTLSEMPDGLVKALSGIEVEDLFFGPKELKHKIGELKKFKLWDKTKALELLGRHLKMFVDKTEITDGSGAPVVIQFSPATYDRAKDSKSPDHQGL